MGYRGPNVNFPENVHSEHSEEPTPWQVEASRRNGDPLTAILGFAFALAGLWLLYFGRSVAVVATILGALGIVLSSMGWRYATVRSRPTGLAIAGILVGVSVTVIALLRLS
jgi:hypothetical protein